MSASKDHYGFGRSGADTWNGSRGDGRDWADVSPRHRCPVCGSDSWCQVHREGHTVLCKRVASDREKVNRDGWSYYIHRLHKTPQASVQAQRPVTRVDRAPVEVLDRAYRAMLNALQLVDVDREGLRARGLDDATIDANGYRSLPARGRARLAREVAEAVGEDHVLRVPGVVWRTEGTRGWLHVRGSEGLLVPVRDAKDRMVALKVRRRDVDEQRKRYVFLTSAPPRVPTVPYEDLPGPSAASVVHVPLASGARRGSSRLILTEGELKADVCVHLARAPVVSIPGVSAWAAGVEAAAAWGATNVDVCLDMDRLTNKHVAEAARLIVEELQRKGLNPVLRRWDPRLGKGLDDFLWNRRRREAMTRAA